MSKQEHTIEITEYTDPYCTWCWGSEPTLRHLQEAYGDLLTIRFVMGGLVEDIDTFYDAANRIGGEGWEKQVAAHWVEASRRHGMPVNVSVFEKAAFKSTWPASIAYEAAKLQDEALAKRYLRRLREAATTEGQPIHLTEVLADLAEESGLDRSRFLADFDGPAKDEFARDRRACTEAGANGFPTFRIAVDGRERVVHGYRTYPQMVQLIEMLAGEPIDRRHHTFDDLGVLDFVERYGSAAVREVSEVFEVSPDTAEAALGRLVAGGSLELPLSGLIYRPIHSASCDTATGLCV